MFNLTINKRYENQNYTYKIFQIDRIPKSVITYSYKVHEEIVTFINCWWEYWMKKPMWRIIWQYLAQFHILLTFHLAIQILGVYWDDTMAKEKKRQFHITAKIFNQQKPRNYPNVLHLQERYWIDYGALTQYMKNIYIYLYILKKCNADKSISSIWLFF